jgi:dolichol-phosphate mannosyltransferase
MVVMDCDLQDRPEEIPGLYARASEGYDVVLARRKVRRDSPLKRLSSWAFYRVFNYMTDMNYDGSVANFSIVSRRVVRELDRMGESVRFYGGFLAWMGFRKSYIDVQHDPRLAGGSSYTFVKLVTMASHIMLAHSNKPLRLAIRAGLLLSALSILAGVVHIIRVILYGTPVIGWPTLIISIYFSTGAIISTLGVLGLYIERIFIEVKGRPLFIVRASTFDKEP